MRLRDVLVLGMIGLSGCGDNVHLADGSLLVTPADGLRTSESGGTATFTVTLTNEPAGDVVVELTSLMPSEGTLSAATLTFTRGDYAEPQTVTLTGVDDDRADGDRPYTVRLATERLGTIELDATNEDDDTAGFTVSPLSGLSTSEAGATATFSVRLSSEPAAAVTVPVASTNPSEGTIDRSALTFTPQDWATAQIVTVTGQQDLIADGSIAYTVELAAAVSDDPGYQGLDPADVALANIDDDTSGIAVTAAASLATTEAGGEASFDVVLQTEPTADVTVAVTTTNANEATASVAQLVFTPSDWNQAQTVTVSGVDDFVDDGDRAFTIELGAATSTDAMYSGFDPDDVDGTNADDDTAGILAAPAGGLTTTEDGEVDTFEVSLTSEPTADVTIPVGTSDSTEGTTAVSSLVFTPANWNQPQTVVVTGVDDMSADGDIAYLVTLSAATSTDTLYAGMHLEISAANQDNDVAGVTVDPVEGLFVSEFTDTDDFTIVLNTAPSADVTISLTSSDTTEGTVSPSSVTFTPANWNVPQTVTVTGVNDALDDGNIDFTIVTGATASTDSAYSGLVVPDVAVTNVDNDTAQVYVKARKRLRVSESGGSATFRVRLTVAPTANVTCTLSSSDTTEGLVSPTTLVFQPNQFGFQTVTVVGVEDSIVDGLIPFTIVLDACTSADPNYNGTDPRDVTVLNRDND